MATQLKAYERFLRFERLENTTELMRARAVYIVGWAFVFTQLLNIVLMTSSYGGWTWDHSIAFVGIFATLGVILGLRYTKNFAFFAAMYIMFLIMGVAASAIPQSTGVQSSLLPLLVAGCFIAGFIGGWQMALIYCFASISFVWGLYNVSYAAIAADADALMLYESQYFQRAAQTSIALILGTVFSVFITIAMNQTFVRMEELYEHVQMSEREKTEFLANLSHELRTPLNGINGINRLMLKTPLDANQKKYATIVDRCSKKLSQIVIEALALSKLDSGSFELKSETFNLNVLVDELVEIYKPAANKKGLTVNTKFAPQLPEFYVGDNKRLRQVLKNLVVNALKFTHTGSVDITVDGRLKGKDSVVLFIKVTDTGIGIAEDNHERVFKRFQQVESGLARKNSGTGLGLALSQEIISFMGGKITVESEPGKGSSFIIELTLPVGWPAAAKNETPGQMMQKAAGQRAA